MKKTILIFVTVIMMLIPKVYSYEAFHGNYSYTDMNENKIYTTNSTQKDEEILFLVDFSSSMNSTMKNKSRIKHALDAIKYILSTADISTKIGLRIFGVTDRQVIYRNGNVYKYDLKMLCEASTLILPVAGYNSTNIIEKLENTKPWGVTPIQYSLEQAVQNDFTMDYTTKKHIILVTDGAENCHGNPCKYISELMQLRDDFKIDVIGITVNKNAYSQLDCIARAGKGNFYPVNSPEDFKQKFKQAFSSTPDLIPKYDTASNIEEKDNVPIINSEKRQNNEIIYKNFVYQFDY